jgi:hypothetical protein
MVLGKDGNDHGTILAALGFMNGYGIGVEDFVEIRMSRRAPAPRRT